MKRTLTISMDKDNYIIESNDSRKMLVSRNTLTLKAKDIFESFFSDASLKEKNELNVSIDTKSVVGKEETKLAGEIKSIFDSINSKINSNIQVVSTSNEDENKSESI